MPATPLINTLVTLYVNTAGDLNNNLKENVWFADTDGDIVDDNGGNVENYLTEITKNGNVTWVGAVLDIRANPSDYVIITGVTIKNDNQNNDNQNKVRITGEPSSNPNGNITHVNGRVDGAPNPTPFGYTITFVVGKIDGNGQRTWNTYSIDPKLRIVGS